MYVNYDNPHLNPHRQYAYLRGTGKETIIIALNFSANEASVEINIPDLAFGMLNIPKGDVTAVELLTGEKSDMTLSPEIPFATKIAPYSAVMWKVTHFAKAKKSSHSK